MVTLREIQNLLMNKEFNPYIDIEDTDKVLIHLVEEIGELARSHRKRIISEVLKEIGDCQILLLFYAESVGLDLETATLQKIKDNIQKGKFIPTKECLDKIKPLFEGL